MQRCPFFVREVPKSLSHSVFVTDVFANSPRHLGCCRSRDIPVSTPLLASLAFFLRFSTSNLSYRFMGSDICNFQRFSIRSDVLFTSVVLSIRLNAVPRRPHFRNSSQLRRAAISSNAFKWGRRISPFA